MSNFEQFNEIYRLNPRYYGDSAPQAFCDFVAARSLASLDCLDLGAGQGRYALHLARAGARVLALDASSVAMAQLANSARAEDLLLATEVADLCLYDLPVDEFDLIVSTTVLDHLEESCLPEVVAAVTTALRPGGIIYCEVFTTADPGWHLDRAHILSETAGAVRHYFASGELLGLFPQLTVLSYREEVKIDRAHGLPHQHGLALLVAVKS